MASTTTSCGTRSTFFALRAAKYSMRNLITRATPCVLQPVPVRETANPTNLEKSLALSNRYHKYIAESVALARAQHERRALGSPQFMVFHRIEAHRQNVGSVK